MLDSNEIRCKRIINGITYNTETAALLWPWEEESVCEQRLFKTRHGAYFLYEWDYLGLTEQIIPLDYDAARKWTEDRLPETTFIWEEFAKKPPSEDPEARITLRLPRILHSRIAELAEDHGQSLNAWILRCVEHCAERAEGQEG